jgi:hypothetical protein
MLSRPLQEGAVLPTDNLDLPPIVQIVDMAIVIAIAMDEAEPPDDTVAV